MIRPIPRQFPLSQEATAIAIAADGKRMAAAAASMGRVVVYDMRVGLVLFRFGVTATALAFLPGGVRLVTAWSEPRRAPPSRSGPDIPSSGPTSSPSSPGSETPSTDPNRDVASSRDVVSSREPMRDSARDSSRDSSREPMRDSARDSSRTGEDEARRSIRVWDVVTGRCLSPEPWFGEAPIAVSPDGRWIAAAADRVTTAVLLLRADDGQLERVLDLPHGRSLRSLSFSPDGKWLAASTGVTPVVIWSLETFTARHLEGVHDTDMAVAFSPNGLVAAANENCNVRVFSPESGDVSIHLSVRYGRRLLRGIEALWFSPDDALVVARGRNGTTQIFSRDLGRPLWTASPGPLAFMPEGKWIAAWWYGAIWMREAETGDMVVPAPDEPPASDHTPQDAPKSRRITMRSGEPDVPGLNAVRVATPIAPVISDEPDPALVEAATVLILRLSTSWSGTTYRHAPMQLARDPDGLGVRLPLRGGFAYVRIRPRKDLTQLLVQINADEPEHEHDSPPSSSLARLSRWIRDRFGLEAWRQAAADREWAAELAPHAPEGDVRIERGPGTMTIIVERAVLPSIDDIEALVQKAEQKLSS